MRGFNLSISSMSILLALGLAVWEVYFFYFGGYREGPLHWFTPDRLGFNMAWLAVIYLSFQLLSIPFSVGSAGGQFAVVDGLASVLPLGITIVVIFGRPELLRTPERWEAAILLFLIAAADLFGGYTINLALSRRTMAYAGPPITHDHS